MEKVTAKQKSKLQKKLLDFQLKGLLSYRKYLDKELINASKKSIKKYYKAYIEKEIIRSDKKIKQVKEKLK